MNNRDVTANNETVFSGTYWSRHMNGIVL